MSFINIDQVKEALRIEDEDADSDLALKIVQAEEIVMDFIQPKPDTPWTEDTVPGEVSAAAILVVGYLRDNTDAGRDALAALSGEAPGAPSPVKGLLWRKRQPSIA